jgi:hypothetical protein
VRRCQPVEDDGLGLASTHGESIPGEASPDRRPAATSIVRRVAMTRRLRLIDDIRLDHPVYAALTGSQSRFREIRRQAVRCRLMWPRSSRCFPIHQHETIDAVAFVPAGSYVVSNSQARRWSIARWLTNSKCYRCSNTTSTEAMSRRRSRLIGLTRPRCSSWFARPSHAPLLNRKIDRGRYVGIRRDGRRREHDRIGMGALQRSRAFRERQQLPLIGSQMLAPDILLPTLRNRVSFPMPAQPGQGRCRGHQLTRPAGSAVEPRRPGSTRTHLPSLTDVDPHWSSKRRPEASRTARVWR